MQDLEDDITITNYLAEINDNIFNELARRKNNAQINMKFF
jgi:hypothetical protein